MAKCKALTGSAMKGLREFSRLSDAPIKGFFGDVQCTDNNRRFSFSEMVNNSIQSINSMSIKTELFSKNQSLMYHFRNNYVDH